MNDTPQADLRLTEEQQLAVIGHFMTSPDFYYRMAPTLPVNYFMSLKVRNLYTYLIEMREAGARIISSTALKSVVKQKQSGDVTAQKVYCEMVDMADRIKSDFTAPVLIKLLAEQRKEYEFKNEFNDFAKAASAGDREKVIEAAQRIADLGNVRVTTQPTEDENLRALREESARWRESLRSRVPFIDDRVNARFMLSPGITFVGGVAKSGKSTILANLVPSILRYRPDKKVLIISNEDNLDLVASRIACCDLGMNLREYRFEPDRLTEQALAAIDARKEEIASKIVVASMPHYDTACMEVVIDLLEDAKAQNYSAILLDYYQIVASSKRHKNENYVDTMKRFGTYLKGYAATLTIPMILFGQLVPRNEKDKSDIPLQQRVQSDHHIINHVQVGLEISREKGNLGENYTNIICHVSRHGDPPGKIASFDYEHGRLIYRPERS